MLKITKFGMVCAVVADMALYLGFAEDEAKDHQSALNTNYYHMASGLADYLRGIGIEVEFASDFSCGRFRFIGIGIKDGTKGSPAFAPCARCVFSGFSSSYEKREYCYPAFERWCEESGYNSEAITKEMKKLYHCK